ncbi:TIM barrel protein [Lederbergia sp. NSJ-179]|uniref:hydroxypyruvate isomerase family protein n=1 Tax=Lederbergia sp. NSJ-179 TaxID=2931402 RepID=UPI001FD5A7D5|nr:TIM barrel protein [Lederbergia sp. NSJ-179]MCJ7842095.1 TIM barrel protein [Lederbergia sp. NSJ-179]
MILNQSMERNNQKFSICVDSVYSGRDFFESLEEINQLGFTHFEFWSWWNKDIKRIAKEKKRLNLQVSSFCTKFVSLVDASKRDDYLKGLQETLTIAKELDCKIIITQVGDELANVSRKEQYRNVVNGLKACIPILSEAGVTLVVEPLNTLVDHPGYYLYSSDEGFAIIEEVNNRHVKLLYDIYHQQIMEGHLISRILANIDKIGHFHAAGNPGRHELDMGEIHYPSILEHIKKSSYKGVVGLEYFPVDDPAAGLNKLRNLTIRRSC